MSQKQADLFGLELDADATDDSATCQGRLDFSSPFCETRSMRMQSAECAERSRLDCDRFAEDFAKGQPDDDDDDHPQADKKA
jgi:hypothetical protein